MPPSVKVTLPSAAAAWRRDRTVGTQSPRRGPRVWAHRWGLAHGGAVGGRRWGTTVAGAHRAGTSHPHEGFSACRHRHSLSRARAPRRGTGRIQSVFGEAAGSLPPLHYHTQDTTAGLEATEFPRHESDARQIDLTHDVPRFTEVFQNRFLSSDIATL